MQYTNNLRNFFGNAANTIKAKIAELNPINKFIKFSLQQLFQEFIKDQTISLENLISGIIQLPNLELDTQKINKKYFFASPYVLHSGTIGHLQIKLPSFTQIEKQNIEVQIKKIHINLQPIQNFEQNFKKVMEQIKDFLYHFVEQQTTDYFVVQNGSRDYFKETLKQLLSNMKVRVQDIAICVNLQQPSNEAKTDSYQLLLKVPLINVHRGIGSIKNEKQKVEQINFDCEIPQFLVHLTDELSAQQEGFPFSFPAHTHSSTVLMFGISKFTDLKIETDERIPRFNISIWKNVQKSEKKVKLSFSFPQLELMLDPTQIMIIILFAKQINIFNHRLNTLKNQLKIGDYNQRQQVILPGLISNRSNLYSSVSISVLQSSILDLSNFAPQLIKLNHSSNIIDTILQSNGELFQSTNGFNSMVREQIQLNAFNNPVVDQIQRVNFKQLFQIRASIDNVIVYIQKYHAQSDAQKVWNFHRQSKYPQLKNSYFLLSVQTINFHLRDDNSIQTKVSDIRLEQVQYKIQKQSESKGAFSMQNTQNQEEHFSDLKTSKQFYTQSQLQLNKPTNMEHYCVEQILTVTHLNSQKVNNKQIKAYNFMATLKTKHNDQLYRPGLIFQSYPPNSSHNQKKNHKNRFEIMDITLQLNTEIVKEILDLYLLIEKEVFTLLEQGKDLKDKKKQEGASNTITLLTVRETIFGFVDQDLQNVTSCVQKYQNVEKQEFKRCFCGTTTQGIYLKLEQLDLRKNRSNTKLGFSRLGLGFIRVDNSLISSVNQILKISETLQENEVKRVFRLSYQDGKQGLHPRVSVIIPQILIESNQPQTLDCIDLVHKQFQRLKPQLTKLIQTSSIVKENSNIRSKSDIPNRSLEPILSFFIEKLNFRFSNLQAELGNVFFYLQKSLLSLKFSTFVLALRDQIQFYTSKMQNKNPILVPHPKIYKYKKLLTTNIGIEFHAAPNPQYKCIKQKMNQFLQKISKAKTTFSLTVKNPETSAKQTENIEIVLSAPIYVDAATLIRISQSQQVYNNFIEKVKMSIDKMKKTIIGIYPLQQNKNQQQKDIQRNKQIVLSKGELKIDIRPTFIESSNNLGKSIILSNTRSLVQICWPQSKITQDEKKTYLDGSFDLKVHFRYSQNHLQDKIQTVQTNFITQGFAQVLQLQKLTYRIEIIKQKIRANVQIHSLSSQSTLETISWLNLHFKHFLYHNINKNLGFTLQQNEDRTVQLNAQDYNFNNTEIQIVNLDDGLRIYTQRERRKKQLETEFMSQNFVKPSLDQNCQFYIQIFLIKSIKFKLRNSAKASIDLIAQNFQIQGKVAEFSNLALKMLGSISDLKIVHQNKPQETGFFSSWSNYIYKYSLGQFTVLQNHGQIKFLFEKDDKRTYIKFEKCSFDFGFRSVILQMIMAYNILKQSIKESGWKKVYDKRTQVQEIEEQGDQPLILVAIPANTISVSLIYDWYSILSRRSVEAPKFILHEQNDKINKIDQYVIDWVKTLLSNNVSGLVTGALMENFNLVASQIVNLVSFLLSCIF